MPGPNDYHIGDDSQLHSGLGPDEPSEAQRQGIRSAGQEKLRRLKEELEAQTAELTERERATIAREEAAIRRETELDRREQALKKAEKAGKTGPAQE